MNIQWLKSFELGVPEIDGDHQTLLKLLQCVETATKTGDRAKCDALFDRIICFIHTHFEREEYLLARWGYPNTGEHAEYHKHLVDKIAAVKQMPPSRIDGDEFAERYTSALGFIVDDVVRGDLKFKSFLYHAGVNLESTSHTG